MFGFFGKKKLRNLVAAHIATLMNGSLWSLRSGDAEKLAEKLLTDKFALGYIFGVAGAGLQVFGVSEAEERGLVLIAVFDSLFLENGLEIQNKCIDWAKKKDKLFFTIDPGIFLIQNKNTKLYLVFV